MPKIKYKDIKFRPESLALIKKANDILNEYASRGIIVTLRQLYYQFVARNFIRNKDTEYKRLGGIVNDARLAGLIDWDMLQDRTRNLQSLSHWEHPGGVIQSAAGSYHRDLWEGQENYVEVWIEKDALVSVIEGPCEQWDVPYFSCRGYTSQSEMWGAARRLLKRILKGQRVHIIHMGDHDPSGKDMSRDIEDRLRMFMQSDFAADFCKKNRPVNGELQSDWAKRVTDELVQQRNYLVPVEIHRIALNMDQIEQYNPPPNPAKITDSRANAYIEEFGNESWELDALDPDVLVALVEDNIGLYLDKDLWNEKKDQQEEERGVLNLASQNWESVTTYLEENHA